MGTDTDLESIRHNIYMSYSQDGLWDILFGLFLLVWGNATQFELGWFPGPTFIALYLLVLALKRRITYPRIGYVKFAANNKSSRIAIAFTLTFLFNILVFLLYVGKIGEIPRGFLLFIFGVMTAMIISLIGYWWKVKRLYAWASLILTAFVIYQWLGTPVIFSFIIPGSIMWIYGMVLLFRFIRSYPRLDRENQVVNE